MAFMNALPVSLKPSKRSLSSSSTITGYGVNWLLRATSFATKYIGEQNTCVIACCDYWCEDGENEGEENEKQEKLEFYIKNLLSYNLSRK